MINVTEDFKTAAKAPVKTIRASIYTEEAEICSSADFLQSVNIESTGFYFGVSTKSLEAKLIGVNYNLLDEKVFAKYEILVNEENNIWSECILGSFIIKDQAIDLEKGITTIKGYDQIGIMGLTKYDGSLKFNNSVDNLIRQIADRFGLDYEKPNLPNIDYVVKSDQYLKSSEATFRNILAEIAGATASVAIITNTDKLALNKISHTSLETLTYDNLKKIKLQPKYGVVNAIVLARTPQEDNIVATDDASIAENGLTEIKLANNYILDDDRQELVEPLFQATDGFYFYPFEATTEGHGWYEICDRIEATDNNTTWPIEITGISFTISASGVKEIIKGVAPTDTQTNYALAGSVTKTIFNTEIKVDKNKQQIDSIVSRQDSLESESVENYSRITQEIANVTTTIQETGGANLIYNSVGYDIEANGHIIDWTATGSASSSTSPESMSYGAISGNQISLGSNSKVIQRVLVDGSGGQKYSFAIIVKKSTVGSARISLSNDLDNFSIDLPDGEEIIWQKYNISGFTPSMNYLDLKVETTDTADFAFTDLLLIVGNSIIPWVQASGETLNTQVAITRNGVKVKSSIYAGDYVEITPLEFAGYSSVSGAQEKVFTLNRDTTTVQKLHAESQIEMPPIKIVPITSGSRAGWAFVKKED